MKLTFEVLGEVVPKGRPRFTRFGHAYTPEKTARYEREVKKIALATLRAHSLVDPISAPVLVSLTAYMKIPQSWSNKKRRAAIGTVHSKKPDLDNLVKSVVDGINGGLLADDSQVCTINAKKLYGETPKVEVTIETVDID